MKHPLVGKAIYFYLAAWIMVIIIHTAIVQLIYRFSLGVSLSDAMVFTILLAGIGLSYWYVVQYITPANQKVYRIVLIHVAGVLISVSLVVFTAGTILKLIHGADRTYVEFANATFLWRIFFGACFLALIIMIYYLLQYNDNLRKKEHDEMELQNMLRHSELEMLKFQVNPHFIFNSLNSISALTHTDPDRAREMIIRLSDFLRTSLHNNPDEHRLKDELEHMKHYLEIEKIRFGERLQPSFEVDDQCYKMGLPNMILQPLYENAIKHGVYDHLGPVEVKTVCACEKQTLRISISNNYDSDALPRKGKGIGLKNVQHRLALIYGLRGLVTIEKNRTNFTVHLLIPQRQQS